MKKINFDIIFGALLAIMTIWVIGYTSPKLYDIYKDRNKVEVKTDTVIYADTVYLDKTVTDTVPKTVYQTIVMRDTLYRVKGDSIEQTPVVTVLKKKLYREPLCLMDRIALHYNTKHQ